MARLRGDRSFTPRVIAVLGLCLAPLGVVALGLAWQPSWREPAIVVLGYLLGGMLWQVGANQARRTSYVPPSNLPPPPTRMVGREDKTAELQSYLLDETIDRRIANVHGVAGIGKTAFALYVAHRVANAFNGGELFVHFDPDMKPAQVVETARQQFIRALSPPGAWLPPGVKAQAALYHKLIKRLRRENQLLVVFDDVIDAELAYPLLPDTPWCVVIITSRDPIRAISVRKFQLGQLDEESAVRMLGAIISNDRVQRERGSAEMMIRAAAYHPLAIQLIGMALADRPHTLLSVALQRMTEAGGRRAGTFDNALDLSYAMLTSGEQRALTMLGLMEQRRFAAWELAALLDTSEGDAWLFCERLTDAGLLERQSTDATGVQSFLLLEHVEGYARRRTGLLPPGDTEIAARRLYDHRDRRRKLPPTLGTFERIQVTVEQGALSRAFKEARDAVALARELEDAAGEAEAIAMLAELHAELGGHEDVRDLLKHPLGSSPVTRMRAQRISAKLYRRLRQVDHARMALNDAIAMNGRIHDPVEQVRLLREWAIVESVGSTPHIGLKLIEQARAQPTDYLRLRAGLAYAEGRVLLAVEDPTEAFEVLREGADDASSQGQILWKAWIVFQQAKAAFQGLNHPEALTLSLRALESFGGMRHRYGNAHCRQLIGQILQAQGDLDGATRFFSEALETFHNCGDAWVEAEAAEQLANAWLQRGATQEAVALLASARRLYTSIGADTQAARIDVRQSGGETPVTLRQRGGRQ